MLFLCDTEMESAPAGSTVLMYGTDAFLLETRRLVLTSAGYRVSCVFGLYDLEHVSEISHPHLVVLCHSLSSEEQKRACTRIRQTSPQSRIILLSTYDRN